MLQDTENIELKYKLFIEKVTATKLVWGLSNKKGWANADSSESEEISVIPFWSERAYAKACAKDDWRDYTATEMPLAEFLEAWCTGMASEGILAGVNWDADMFGKEVNALNLALDILNRLKEMSSAIKFKDFAGIEEFIADIEESIN